MNFRNTIVSPITNTGKNSTNVIQNLREPKGQKWGHPMVDLPTLITQVKSFADIIALANSGVDWKKDAYDKGMKWAIYFEKVRSIKLKKIKFTDNGKHSK